MMSISKNTTISTKTTTSVTFAPEDVERILVAEAQRMLGLADTDEPTEVDFDAGCCSLASVRLS